MVCGTEDIPCATCRAGRVNSGRCRVVAYGCPVAIIDKVPGGLPAGIAARMTAGLTRMGLHDVPVIATTRFVPTVQHLTSNDEYHDDRNGGSVAARTVTTTDGEIVIVANWEVMATLTGAEVERIFAHEAGHVSIDGRGEGSTERIADLIPDHYWDFQVAHGVAIALDEYRCEAAAYRAGYPVEEGRDDDGLTDDLFGLNVQLLHADHEYQTHRDVAQLRDDVLRVVIFHIRYMATIVARHLHNTPVDPFRLNQHARKNWEVLIAPTWERFVAFYRDVPEAFDPWPAPADAEAAVAVVGLVRDLTESFGYEAGRETFWIRATRVEWQDRLDRANREADAGA